LPSNDEKDIFPPPLVVFMVRQRAVVGTGPYIVSS